MTSQILNTTQSAVSKSVASMENILGLPLFERKNKKLELTASGKLLAKEWRNLVQNAELTVDKAFLMYEREQRSVIVGERDSMKTDKDYWPQIEQFQKKNQDIRLIFVERSISELVGKLISNELDIIFTIDYEVPILDKLRFKKKLNRIKCQGNYCIL
ncbi:MAG: LysR family transcriptional regulator [Eubacteriaceae bacterium]